MKAGDITDHDLMRVAVSGTRPRVIDLDPAWSGLLRSAVSEREADEFVLLPSRPVGKAMKNLVSNLAGRQPTNGLRPNAQRMRATWIVGRLRAGSDPMRLVADAGVQSMAALARYERFV